MENIIFEIIVHSGNARSYLYEALDYAKREEYSETEKLMSQAADEMTKAHNIQTKMIQQDIDKNENISLLLIHAQDQLMTMMSEQTLIERLIEMQKELNILKSKFK